MSKNHFELSLELQEKIKEATPSFHLGAWLKGESAGEVALGENYPFYDLASLTKVIFTTTACMVAVDREILDLGADVNQYLSWYPSGRIRVEQLLAHYSGLTWWLPLHESLQQNGLLDASEDLRRKFLQEILLKDAWHPMGKAVYSDLDFWMLGLILREVFQQELHAIWGHLASEMKNKDLHFCAERKPKEARESYAPTEDCPWRGHVLQGEVHDDNAWSLGGVAAHAGLFGSLHGVADWALGLRQAWSGESWVVSTETVRKFFTQHGPGDWALGFMMPALKNSTAGRHMSRHSIGHLGFTGTSFWFDTEHDLMVIALSNRVHPSRENPRFKELRALFHDEIYEQLVGGEKA